MPLTWKENIKQDVKIPFRHAKEQVSIVTLSSHFFFCKKKTCAKRKNQKGFLVKVFTAGKKVVDQTFFSKESLLHDLSHHYRAFAILVIKRNEPNLHKSHTPI